MSRKIRYYVRCKECGEKVPATLLKVVFLQKGTYYYFKCANGHDMVAKKDA